MKTIKEVVSFLEKDILECDPKDGKCVRCDNVREAIDIIRKYDQYVGLLMLNIDDLIPNTHMIKHSNSYKKIIEFQQRIHKIGDVIKWDFKNDRYSEYPDELKDKTFSAVIGMIDYEEKYYGVCAEYGQDMIPFDGCELCVAE